MTGIDFARTAGDYAAHRAGFPAEFFERATAQWDVGIAGQRVLDLGTGTGTLARGFSLLGCKVTGLDPAESLLRKARALDQQAGVNIEYVAARAEATGLPDRGFDVVSAGQCWHWFDRARAAEEAWRLLRPGGSLLIAHFDWLPLPGSVVAATEALILAHNPSWRFAGGCGIHWRWFADLSAIGFEALESFSFDVDQLYSHEAWRGRIRASAGVAASLPPEEVGRFDAEHAALLSRQFQADPLHVPHRVFALIGRKHE